MSPMISVLLTITVAIGVILIGLLFFVVGKLNWLETATNSLLTKIDIASPKSKPQEIQYDPYFYGLTGQALYKCLVREDLTQATPLELDEIRPRYGIALLKALVKFIQDGLDVSNNVNTENTVFECEKLVFTSRGQIGVWLPADRVENLRVIGSKIAKERRKASEKNGEGAKASSSESITKEIESEIGDLCDSLLLRHGDEIASDVSKAFFNESTS
ncbi:MAG: hypothetical protein P8K27_01005 [Gammaproteobacteria bacterium]|nr:hypothetical protein [Gammaproteobacteria bacterium]